jgi:UDP-2-acetamido-3-amino-2,3-dideoxy-glucuronate N-acetyltransferase
MSDEPFVHETAVVDPGAEVGPGTKIWHFCHVMPGARIGRDCMLAQNVFVASGAVIGDRTRVQNNVSIFDGVVLEEGVFVGPSAVFTNVHHPRTGFDRHGQFEHTLVRRGATIGANATVVCGVEIGERALVGAGAVVTRDVVAHAVMTGVPARRTGWACDCGAPLPEPEGGTCVECGRSFREVRGALERWPG